MTDAAKEARREYKRKWQRENRDKVRQYQANYWNRKAQAAAGDPAADDPAQEASG